MGTKLQNRVWTMRRFEREAERNLGARHHARARMEKENLSSFLARPSCSSHDRNPLSLPFRTPARVRMTRHACPTLCGDRIRLLCFGFSTLSEQFKVLVTTMVTLFPISSLTFLFLLQVSENAELTAICDELINKMGGHR